MATKILLNAINGEEKSERFVMYYTNETAELPKQFVLRLDETENRNGDAQLQVSNANIGLIASHQPEYITNILTGFRRDVGDVTCIVAERFIDDLPNLSNAKKGKVY